MLKLVPLMLFMLLACLLPGRAQVAPAPGSIKIQGLSVKIGPKKETLKRKRFYLFRGGLEANNALLEKLRATEPISRDCFYCRNKASAEMIAWLKAENCESPYCREITAEDVKKVPEFRAAYRKGLAQHRGRPELARKWIMTNIPAGLRDGFYKQKKKQLAGLLGNLAPLQSVMTDRNSVVAHFIDIPLNLSGKKSEVFFVSNLLPVEMNGQAYIWACEIDVLPGRLATLTLTGQSTKKCEVIVRPLPACAGGSCEIK